MEKLLQGSHQVGTHLSLKQLILLIFSFPRDKGNSAKFLQEYLRIKQTSGTFEFKTVFFKENHFSYLVLFNWYLYEVVLDYTELLCPVQID